MRKLTPISIEKIKPHPTLRREIADGAKPGLYLVIQPSGKKSWAVRYRRLSDGRSRKLTINGTPSLAAARKLAQAALDKAAEGHDPAAEKKVARQARGSDLFADIAAQFLARHIKPKSRASYAYEVERMLNKEVLPCWGSRRIQEISKRDVLDLVDGIIDRGGGLTANRVLAATRKLFNWAQDERRIIAASPVDGIKPPLDEVSRDRILTDDEIGLFWQACNQIAYPFGSMAQLLLLTGQRRNEVAGMTWGQLDQHGSLLARKPRRLGLKLADQLLSRIAIPRAYLCPATQPLALKRRVIRFRSVSIIHILYGDLWSWLVG